MNKTTKYYKVVKACAGLSFGDVMVKAEGGLKSAYHKLTDESVRKVVYCICKKSLRKLETEVRPTKTGDKILIIYPYMTSGEYVLGDFLSVKTRMDKGADVPRSTGGAKWVSPDEYVIVTNWDDEGQKPIESINPAALAKPVESHDGFKVGDKVVSKHKYSMDYYGVVYGFSLGSTPYIKFYKENDYLHTGHGNLKSDYKEPATKCTYFIDTHEREHFNELTEHSKRILAAIEKATVAASREFNSDLLSLDNP